MDEGSRAAQGMTVRREVLGMPAVNRAFAVAQQVLAEAG